MMKKIFIILFLIIIAITYPTYKFIEIQYYKSKVDQKLHDKLSVMEKSKEQYQKYILFRPDKLGQPENELEWGDVRVRLNNEDVKIREGSGDTMLYDIIQIKNNSSEWENLIRNEAGFCEKGVIGNNKLLCLGSYYGYNINIIDQSGQFITKKLISTPYDINRSFFLDGKTLYFIFTDDRFVWTWLPDDAPHQIGIRLLVAGELNVDTLEFKEHVIGYGNPQKVIPAVNQSYLGNYQTGLVVE